MGLGSMGLGFKGLGFIPGYGNFPTRIPNFGRSLFGASGRRVQGWMKRKPGPVGPYRLMADLVLHAATP